MKTKYLFYFCDGIGSVFDSQVLALLNAINEKKVFTKIFLFLGLRNENQKTGLQKRNIDAGIELLFFKSYPNYPGFNGLIRKNLLKAINEANVNLEEVIFHIRGEVVAWHLNKILASNYQQFVIPDIRGATFEEVREFSELGYVKKKLKEYNYIRAWKNLSNFGQLSTVSYSLKKYLTDIYKIDPSKIYITPCLSNSGFKFDPVLRAKIREELNLKNDDILIVFSSGGIANWQNNSILKILADKGLKVLNLSRKEIHHKNIINKFVPYTEMPEYLNAADIAIIWRGESIVNKVASPVKFSEYVCCGLPVIASKYVDMISDYITRFDCGILVGSLDEIDSGTIEALHKKDRNKISEDGIMSFGIETITNKYLQTYSLIKNL